MVDIETRLSELGLELPEAVAPVANYAPFAKSGQTVYISGQISLDAHGLVTGRLGDTLDLKAGQAAARLCAINLIAQFKAACGGDLNRVRRVLRLGGFVNVHPAFTDIPKVINGASDLMVDVFGKTGRHARSAVGVAALPLGAAVEVDAVIEIA